MRNFKEELANWNYDNGAFEIFGLTITHDMSEMMWTVSNEWEAIDYTDFNEVIKHIELFQE